MEFVDTKEISGSKWLSSWRAFLAVVTTIAILNVFYGIRLTESVFSEHAFSEHDASAKGLDFVPEPGSNDSSKKEATGYVKFNYSIVLPEKNYTRRIYWVHVGKAGEQAIYFLLLSLFFFLKYRISIISK